MSHYEQNRLFFNGPVLLEEEYRHKPLDYIVEFFLDYDLADVRENQYEILEACLLSDRPQFNDRHKRANIMFYLQTIEKLFEAAFLLAQRKKD